MSSLAEDFNQSIRNPKLITFLFLLVLLTIYLLSGIYSVATEQRGVVKRLGRIIEENATPGIHYHLPWPLESVVLLNTTAIRHIRLDFRSKQEQVLPGGLLTGDENILSAEFNLQYSIHSPKQYLSATGNPEQLIEQISKAEIVKRFALSDVDWLLTTGRSSLQNAVRHSLQQQLDTLKLGIRIRSVQVSLLTPPSTTKAAFDRVAHSRSDKRKVVEQERGEQSSRVHQARSEANRQLQQARAYAYEVVEKARGDSDRFKTSWQAFGNNRRVTADRLLLETAEKILGETRLIVIEPGQNDLSNDFSSNPEKHLSNRNESSKNHLKPDTLKNNTQQQRPYRPENTIIPDYPRLWR